MKRRTLSQPSKRRSPTTQGSAPTAQSTQSPNQTVIPGRTVVEVTAGQLAGLRGVVLATSSERWSIQLEATAHGVMLSIDPKWLQIVASESP
jgi:hypothetical protein